MQSYLNILMLTIVSVNYLGVLISLILVKQA